MPTVIRGEGNGTFIGIDGSFANVLAKTMNATPVYLTEKYYAKIFYGNKKYNGSNYGTMAAVVDRRAELTANGHFLRDYGCYVGELTRHITNDKVCLLAPKAGVMPPMITVLKSFQYEVWIMMAVTYIVTALIYFAGTTLNTTHTGPTGCNLGLELYRMFIGAPTNRAFAQSGQKMLTLFCLLYTVVILNAFQGSLVTFLSTPMHYPDLNTFKELEKSDVPIRTFSLSFKEILTNDPNLRNLASRVEKWESQVDLKNSDGYHVGFQRVNVFNLGHFKDIFYSGNKTRPRALHTMNECLISYYISYVVHRHSPYKKRINTVLSWIDQAGLVTKWNSDVTKYIFNEYRLVNPKDHEKSKVFTVRDLEVAFIILFFGLVLSFSVFVIELLICKKPIQQSPQHLPFIL
ncbi:uncharacterized protein LOC126843260 [Adelges cooleyi]|uniref:uncharacterized protein LOC126843260 n=1 Tax=Adelges cooleyi TaxID=133065 RepID=UPI0021808734|nr:uncharacterized protein LOC126843260 [Adelges cooleyi]